MTQNAEQASWLNQTLTDPAKVASQIGKFG